MMFRGEALTEYSPKRTVMDWKGWHRLTWQHGAVFKAPVSEGAMKKVRSGRLHCRMATSASQRKLVTTKGMLKLCFVCHGHSYEGIILPREGRTVAPACLGEQPAVVTLSSPSKHVITIMPAAVVAEQTKAWQA